MDQGMETALQIYAAYRSAMSAVGIEYSKPAFDDMKHWAKTAKLTLRNGIDPVRFVNAQFAVLPKDTRGALTPRMLHDPVGRVLRAYTSTSPTPVDYAALNSKLQTKLASLKGGPATQQSILEDPDMPFPAWFRVAAADEITAPLDAYMAAARKEVEGNASLRKFINKEYPNNGFASGDERSSLQ